MKSLTDPYILSNGVAIPCVGFGTWQVQDGPEARDSTAEALRAGYRHIDTAQGYGNEESVGRAVKESGLSRADVFLTSKLANPVRGYDQTISAVNESLRKLGTDYLDLFLIHWPRPVLFKDDWEAQNAQTWRAMEHLYGEGKLRSIGVSNFRPHHIKALLKTASVKPMVNQIRLAPGDTQDEVVNFSRDNGMLLEAYSPLGVGKVFEVPQMKDLARKYGKSIAQIAIRWSLQRGYLPLPKSVTPERIRENTQIFDFRLEDADVELIAGLKGCVGYSSDPDSITW